MRPRWTLYFAMLALTASAAGYCHAQAPGELSTATPVLADRSGLGADPSSNSSLKPVTTIFSSAGSRWFRPRRQSSRIGSPRWLPSRRTWSRSSDSTCRARCNQWHLRAGELRQLERTGDYPAQPHRDHHQPAALHRSQRQRST
jgi:hypothetical protein